MLLIAASLLNVLEALLWSIGIGFLARSLIPWSRPQPRPGPLITVAAGFGGCLLGFVVGHELLQNHDFHLFKPESLIPAVIGSAIILIAIRRALRSSQPSWRFR